MPKLREEISVDEFLATRTLSSHEGVLYRAAAMPKSFDAASRSAVFVMTDESVDSYGDIVKANGANLDRFVANPIALLNHRSDMVIGTWSDVTQKGKRVEGKVTVAKQGTAPHIDMTYNLMEQGILKAASIGFMPTKVERRLDDEGEPMWSYVIHEWELYECSVVSVPANPSALAKSMRDGNVMARDLLEEVLDTYTKTASGLIVPKSDLEAAYKEALGNRTAVVVEAIEPEPTVEPTPEKAADTVAVSNDLADVPVPTINLMAGRGVVFLTELKTDTGVFAGTIVAASWDAADTLAAARGTGEEVIGQLVEVSEASAGEVPHATLGGTVKTALRPHDDVDEPQAATISQITLDLDITAAEDKVTHIGGIMAKLAAKFPMFFPKSVDVDPIESEPAAPPSAEDVEAAKAKAAGICERLAAKGLIEA